MRSGSAAGTGSGRAVGRRTGGHGGNRARKSRNQGVFWQTLTEHANAILWLKIDLGDCLLEANSAKPI